MRSGNCSIEEKVAFLRRPASYPQCAGQVEIIQTHMSWVFLTDKHAFKLKKPVRNEYLDFSTPEARRLNCSREVRFNRRLARDVYLGIVPLTFNKNRNLQLGGRGQRVDSLVLMRRLPASRMLDHLIRSGAVSEKDIANLASYLATFYKNLAPASITCPQYRKCLAADLERAGRELGAGAYGLPAGLVQPLIQSQLEFLQRNGGLFDDRIRAGKIIEGHGDLRPEHVCLEESPVVIDCLEFRRSLRMLDAASELTFLALECERLGAPVAGEIIFRRYEEETGDRPPRRLLAFYKVYHACIRAKIALWHLQDERIRNRASWISKAAQYLTIVSGIDRAA
jgi:aminoglycoside phosphotransferase family enzyme